MADPNDGTPVGGRQAVQETLREGVGSVNTEKATITERFDPTSAASIYYHWACSSIDGLGVDKTSNATADVTELRLSMDTPATAAEYIEIQDKIFQSRNYPTWDKQRKMFMSFFLDDTSEFWRAGTGLNNRFNGVADARISVRIEGGTLYAEVSDNSTVVEQQLRTGVTSGQFGLFVDFDGATATNPEAEITLSKYPIDGSTTPTWTESHTWTDSDPLPFGKDGNKGHWIAWSCALKNPGGASITAHVNDAEYFLDTDSA